MEKKRFVLLTAVMLIALIPAGIVSSAPLSPNDLVDMINELRLNSGVPEIDIDIALMDAAQAHSDYLASTFDINFPSLEKGHIGAGDTYVRDRAITAGYDLEAGMDVIEVWAGDDSDITLTDLIYYTWAEENQRADILNTDAVAIGAGISESESGALYFVVNIGVEYGSGDSAGDTESGVFSTMPTTAVTAAVALVQVSTPQPGGRIVHVVDSGQALWNIAEAYDVTVEQIQNLNNLSNDVISVGQEVVIQLGFTATPSPTITVTSRPPTRTPVPPQTAQAVETKETANTDTENGGFLGLSRQTMGLTLILICGVGLALIVLGNMNKNKKKVSVEKKDDDLPGPDFEI